MLTKHSHGEKAQTHGQLMIIPRVCFIHVSDPECKIQLSEFYEGNSKVMIKSQKDFFAGLMFMAVGTAFAFGAQNYTIGSAARMGPGYFPMLLGILLGVLGFAIILGSVLKRHPAPDGDPVGRWAWRPLFFVLMANFAFGVLLVGLPALGIPSMGIVVAIYALTLIASMASNEFTLKGSLGLATVLAVGSYLVFIKGLSLVLPVWPSFISG